MAFDGITIACIKKELEEKILNGRISKIAQPEKDELLLTINGNQGQQRLIISADPSLPLIYFTDTNKKSPMSAPNFCMLLRKHIQNGRIVEITQPGLERIINLEIEHLDEMGDLKRKTLAVEIMGKHSNIIFYNDENIIIDSMKHISSMVSSVREVLPGRTYFIPETIDKKDALAMTNYEFEQCIADKSQQVFKSIYANYTGISPIVSQEICNRAEVDSDKPTNSLSKDEIERLYQAFSLYIQKVKDRDFKPQIVYGKDAPVEYGVQEFTIYKENEKAYFESISELLVEYYAQKSKVARIRQKSVDLRKIVQTALERNIKKYDIQVKQLKDTEKREKYKVYGELLHTYGYQVQENAKSVCVPNYYTNEELSIPLNPDLSALENAKKYFDKYGKCKRTHEALTTLTQETKAEIEHLESIMNALDIALYEEDLVQIKEELIESGYIRRKGGTRKVKITSEPFHYVSSDGFHMYVGKNNYQNEEITFKLAEGNDWWFHAKGAPGSHVIVKANGKELPDRTFEEAARLAAHYSKNGKQDKVEVDYIQKKHVKKPNGSKPGFVIYHTNYSMMIDNNITGIKNISLVD